MSGIEQWLPHRAPFRFVDEVLEVGADSGRFCLHLAFDDARLTDGTLQPLLLAEAIAQSTAAFNGHEHAGRDESGLLVELSARFSGFARGGETVELEIERLRVRGPLGMYKGRASVAGRVLVEAELTVMREVKDTP